MTDECEFHLCKHPPSDHKNGSCWAVTQPEKQGPDMFCKCDSQWGINQRLYDDLGYMVVAPTDMMVTKKCKKCRANVLLRRDESMCLNCRPFYTEPLKTIPEFIIRVPISQTELQRML